jgi:hypothetical protein
MFTSTNLKDTYFIFFYYLDPDPGSALRFMPGSGSRFVSALRLLPGSGFAKKPLQIRNTAVLRNRIQFQLQLFCGYRETAGLFLGKSGEIFVNFVLKNYYPDPVPGGNFKVEPCRSGPESRCRVKVFF